MAYMIYLIIVTQRIIPKLWDPYVILDISRSATEKAIKKQYRKMSLIHHPDKANPVGNQTLEDINSLYVEITKAYKALTDEEIRNNYLQFGHPDGKQSFSIGIALPKLMVEEGMGTYVLLVYGVLLGVLLPYVVGSWWYGTQRVTKEKILIVSAGKLFQQYKDDLSQGGVLSAISTGVEYEQVLKGDKADQGLGRIEKAVMVENDISGPTKKDLGKFNTLEGVQRKTNALLWAYLTRTKLADQVLDEEKYEVAPIALTLNDAFISICLAYGNLSPLLNAFKISQNIIQATTPNSSPLLQLPHFTPSVVKTIEGEHAKTHMSVQEFMKLPEQYRKSLVTKVLDSKDYHDSITVARQMSFLQVETAFFKCRGEKHIVPGSLVQFVVKCRVIPPGTTDIPISNPEELLDVDPAETEEDEASLKRRKGGKARGLQAVDTTEIERLHVPPLAYAPYFPRDHPPKWNLFLATPGQGRIIVPPSTFTTFDQPIFDAQGNPTFAVQTFKLQFQAPSQEGQYSFVMHFVNDSYIGADVKQDVTLTIEDQSQLEEIESDEEISEPDEGMYEGFLFNCFAKLSLDSLAGQMSALKSGSLSGPSKSLKKKKKTLTTKDQDSDESNTEGEDDDESDTDTETEDES